MQHFVQPVNVQALKQATEAVVGQEVTDTIVRVYRAIDQAMFEAYQMAKEDAEANVEERLDNAFDTGFEEGSKIGELNATFEYHTSDLNETYDEGFDDGYLQGVTEARSRPGQADETVQDIISKQASEYYEGLEEQLDFLGEYENVAD